MNVAAGAERQAEVVAFLSDPAAYGEGPVERRETHLSWVFRTPRRAYKLKKPVRLAEVDLTDRAAREAYAREELRLNRRLAPSVYLDALAVVRRNGGLALGGRGEVVDWLLEMRRLPDALMLERMIEEGRAREAHLRAVGATLAAFYAAQPSEAMAAETYRDRFAEEIVRSRQALEAHPDIAPPARLRALAARLETFLRRKSDLIAARAPAVVDGHGDLRPEHVYLENPPAIIDCLDFSRRLRLVDPSDDLAFLAMECTRAGAPWCEPILLETTGRAIRGGPAPAELRCFYKAVHAFTRARLAVLHIARGDPRTPEKWPRQTRERLALAEAHATALIPEARLSAPRH